TNWHDETEPDEARKLPRESVRLATLFNRADDSLCGVVEFHQVGHARVAAGGERRFDEAGIDDRYVNARACQIEAQTLKHRRERSLARAVRRRLGHAAISGET